FDDSIARRHCRQAKGPGTQPRTEHEQADRRTQRAGACRVGYGESLSCPCGHGRRSSRARGSGPARCCGSRLEAGARRNAEIHRLRKTIDHPEGDRVRGGVEMWSLLITIFVAGVVAPIAGIMVLSFFGKLGWPL